MQNTRDQHDPYDIMENTIKILEDCDRKQLERLIGMGAFRWTKTDQFLEKGGLRPTVVRLTMMDAYSDVSGVPLRSFFYGSNKKVYPTYTPLDKQVITMLDVMTAEQLNLFWYYIEKLFPNKLYGAKPVASSNSAKLNYASLFNKMEQHVEWDKTARAHIAHFPQYKRFLHSQEEIDAQIAKMCADRRLNYACPYQMYVDMSVAVGVSVHWVLGLKNNLYCELPEADRIFDYYTTMLDNLQPAFYRFLRSYFQIRLDRLMT